MPSNHPILRIVLFSCFALKTIPTVQIIYRAKAEVSSNSYFLTAQSLGVCAFNCLSIWIERELGIYEFTDISSLKFRALLIALLGLTKYTLSQWLCMSNTHSIWPLKPTTDTSAATPVGLCSELYFHLIFQLIWCESMLQNINNANEHGIGYNTHGYNIV